MTAKTLAALLNGREIGDEITEAEAAQAEAAGLVVLFGASDDLAEFRGAIDDEADCYNRGDLFIVATANGAKLLEPHDDDCECEYCGFESLKTKTVKIEAVWCESPDYSWAYKTDLPHAEFDIVEGKEKYCRGIVFSVKDIPAAIHRRAPAGS